MPKEQIRKRGKRKPKTEDEYGSRPERVIHASQPALEEEEERLVEQPTAGPSASGGIHPDRIALLNGKRPAAPLPRPTEETEQQELSWAREPVVNPDFPFGELDPDLKGYFRTVEDQIKDWEGSSSVGEEREDRQNFLASVLSELRSHELLISTDPDTAVVLERLMPSLGDWGRRVIGDACGDQWKTLLQHRFGSHVAQTWITLAADTLDREERGIWPPQQEQQAKGVKKADEGVLPTMKELFENIVSSLQADIPSLLTNPHASPPVRLLLLVMTPNRALPTLDGSDTGLIRSKKSHKYRKGQNVQGKSILGDENEVEGKGKAKEGEGKVKRKVPSRLVELRKEVRRGLMERLAGAEWRIMGVDAVGCAAVQLLLEFEIEDGDSETPNSLLDHLTEGLVTALSESATPITGEYPASLLTSATGTRLFETILRVSPLSVFQAVWTLYFEGKIGKLAAHPMANFVVARGVGRLGKEGIEKVVGECRSVSGGKALIKMARTSVLQALVDRATALDECQSLVLELIRSCLDLPPDQISCLVPCLMSLKTYPFYQSLLNGDPVAEDDTEIPPDALDSKAEEEAAAAARYSAWQNRRKPKAAEGDLAPNMQGCLLLQALVKLPIANEVVLDSLLAQPIDTLLTYGKSPIASHLLDAVVVSPAAPAKYRRKLTSGFLGRYKELAEDRIGSRVAEKIWDHADGFMKEKIARSLIPHATTLSSSPYGHFLARRLDLHLLERRPDEWRESHIGVKHHFAHQKPQTQAQRQAGNGAQAESERKKRKVEGEEQEEKEADEIDVLFQGVEEGVKKSKKGKRSKQEA